MRLLSPRSSVRFTALLWLSLGLACSVDEEDETGKVSTFGQYEGYSEERFEGWVRTSQYVATRDGTRLAVDIVRPAVDGVAVEEAFPVVWTHSRYHRDPGGAISHFSRLAAERAGTSEDGSPPPRLPSTGSIGSYVDTSPTLSRLLRHGYVFVAVAVRGSGASYGRYEGLFSPAETRDAYDIIDWISTQSWCDGNLGMWGGSYLGITQYMAASQQHPALKPIFPTVALFDFYYMVYPGGVQREDMIEHWGRLPRNLDIEVAPRPVDDDPEGIQRAAAISEHADNWDVIEGLASAFYRDSASHEFSYATHSPAGVLDGINSSSVAAYHWGGWFDTFALDEFLWFANYQGPQKLAVGPWSHTAQGQQSASERARLEAIEHHRWFDYWLKEIDNGVMDEPPIHYALMDDDSTWTWKEAKDWPPASVEPVDFYLTAGPSESIPSINDGLLSKEKASQKLAFVDYTVDPTTTTGTASRWDNAVGQGAMAYPDLAANDAKSLTWTTAPLAADLRVIGHPVVTLYLTSSTGDAALHVLLEEVDGAGVSHYITEGVLRVSHRESFEVPWNNLGLPYQPGRSADPKALSNAPTEIKLDLIPTAQIFNVGHRLRLTVMGADVDNTKPVPTTESLTIRVYSDGEHPSKVRLPLAR